MRQPGRRTRRPRPLSLSYSRPTPVPTTPPTPSPEILNLPLVSGSLFPDVPRLLLVFQTPYGYPRSPQDPPGTSSPVSDTRVSFHLPPRPVCLPRPSDRRVYPRRLVDPHQQYPVPPALPVVPVQDLHEPSTYLHTLTSSFLRLRVRVSGSTPIFTTISPTNQTLQFTDSTILCGYNFPTQSPFPLVLEFTWFSR